MPRGNGTGPMGLGPMTGRGAGFCAGYGVPGCMNPVGGRGGGSFGFGRGGGGFGRGFGRGFAKAAVLQNFPPETAAPDHELAALKSQLANLERLSADLRQRMNNLENTEADKK